jgi:hypothetical protein
VLGFNGFWKAIGIRIFHHKANNRRKKNRIERRVRDDGQVCVNNDELEKMMVDFYEDLCKSEGR